MVLNGSQNASIFHEENYCGIQKYLLMPNPRKTQFLSQLVGLTEESLRLGFSNIPFWNHHMNWTLKKAENVPKN